jgi:predicted N-acetyltransferase YhbS
MVIPAEQRRGIGTELVRVSVDEARRSGCEWLHVDFDRDLAAFYLESCGFGPTEGGLLDIRHSAPRDS